MAARPPASWRPHGNMRMLVQNRPLYGLRQLSRSVPSGQCGDAATHCRHGDDAVGRVGRGPGGRLHPRAASGGRSIGAVDRTPATIRGRRPILLLGFAALPVRGILLAFVNDPDMLVAVQILDGISAAALAVLVPLIIADVTRGTGHFNLAQGIIGTAVGIGASISDTRRLCG